jgi:hypothetical protein
MRRYALIAALIVMGSSPSFAQDAVFVVTMTSADVHKAPSTGSPVIAKAPRGKAFEVRRELGSWVSVAWPGTDHGVAYMHVAWGKVSHGVAVVDEPTPIAAETPRAQPRAPTFNRPAAEPASAPEPAALSTDAQLVQAPRPSRLPAPAPSLPSHVIGVGARLGRQEIGMALTGRAWARGRFGLQLEAGRSTYLSALAPGHVRSLQLAPTVIFSPPNVVTNAVWARPYIGAGLNLHRLTLSDGFGESPMTDSVRGSHLLGGAEFTWANVPQLTVSADVRQQWAPQTFTGFELGGFAASMSAHWYVK